MLQPYIPLLLVIALVIANAILMLAVSHIFSTYRRTPAKIAPYESGMPVLGQAREQIDLLGRHRHVDHHAASGVTERARGTR